MARLDWNWDVARRGCTYGCPMFGRGKPRDAEDPSVAPAEAILDRVATRATVGPGVARPVAERALSICACVSMDDTPTWIIYDEPGGTLRWCRVPDGSEVSEIVDARFEAGGHADPRSVLAWLRGEEPDPWSGGDGWGEDSVVQELGRKLALRR